MRLRRLALLISLLACQSWALPVEDTPPEAMAVTPGLLSQWKSQWSSALSTPLISTRQSVADTTTDVMSQAMNLLGVPYKRGGASEDTGFDCSGFVRYLYEKTFGQILPHRASEQAKATETIERDELKPGDLVFFNTMRRAFSHVGIYLGDGKFIHAPRTGKAVQVDDMRAAYWQKRFNGARRVPTEGKDNAPVR